MTPSEIGALAEARTLAQPGLGTPTQLTNEAEVRPQKRSRVLLATAVLALATGGVVIGYAVMLSRRLPPPAGAAAGQAPGGEATPTVMPSMQATAPSSSKETPIVSPSPPADVEITIQAEPKSVDVFLGNEKIGTAPAPIRMKRGEQGVKLTLKADGYKPADIEVTPKDNTVVSAKLEKIVAGPARAKKPAGELENPF
jgi:hypothetical protein